MASGIGVGERSRASAAVRSGDGSGAEGTVIVPAHDEERVIGRLLAGLAPLVDSGEIDVIVACNGCTDRTAEVARGFPGVRVLELPVGSKPLALDAADALATAWPRVYLDADVVISPRALRMLLRHLGDRSAARAARPPLRYDTEGASALVRAFYRARSRLAVTESGLWGAGVYALNEPARASFGRFPEMTADDLYVDALFGADEKAVLDVDPVVVRTPRTATALLAVLRRTYRGNAEMRRAGLLVNEPAAASSTLRDLLSQCGRPGRTVDAAVYAAAVLAARAPVSRPGRSWERDDTSRTDAAGTPPGGGGRPAVGRSGVGTGRLNVAVVTYNSERYLDDLLRSIPGAAGRLPVSTLVVDNGSTDGTVEIARRHAGVRVIETGANLGYSGGINVARREFGRGDLAILNPDVTLDPGALASLVARLDEGVGVAVPRLRDADGTLFCHLRKESSVLGALGDALFGGHWPGRPRLLTDDLRRPEDYASGRDVAWAGAAVWVVSASCNDTVGAWDDETYFLYSEETDYARRVRDRGYAVRYVPEAGAAHHGGGSGTSAPLLALMAVNRVRYFENVNGPVRARLFRLAVLLGHLLRAPRSPVHRHVAAVVANRRRWPTLPSATGPDGRPR